MKVIFGDGIHDDTEAIQAYLNGEKVLWPWEHNKRLTHICKITKSLIAQPNNPLNPTTKDVAG